MATTTLKEHYTAAVQKIYGIPPPLPEEHHEAINDVHAIVQGIQTQSYDLGGLAQANTVLTSSNSAAMAQLAQITATMNYMKVQLKILASSQTNKTRENSKH